MFYKHCLFYLSCFSNASYSDLIHESGYRYHRSCMCLYFISSRQMKQGNMNKNTTLIRKEKKKNTAELIQYQESIQLYFRKIKISTCTQASPIMTYPQSYVVLISEQVALNLCSPSSSTLTSIAI